jgi:two-component system phosphate regulon sensor histidine kinase PhoR
VKHRIFFRLLAAFALVILAATISFYFLLEKTWQSNVTQEAERNLRQKTQMFAERVEADRQHPLRDIAAQAGQAAGARATIIDVNGKVLADSEADPSTMDNVGERPEFSAALHGQVGISTRSGNRVGVPLLFIAVPIQGGAVRLAYPLADAEASRRELHRRLWLGAFVAFLLSLPLAWMGAYFLTKRPQHVLEAPAAPVRAEIDAPALSPNPIAAPSGDDAPEDHQNQQQLETLLNSMQDAVIAVDAEGRVQWANQGMQELTQRVRLQAPLVETVRDPEFLRAMQEAAETKTVRGARAISIVSGKTFDVTAAPLPDGGAVAVLRDLTERELLEKTRRDFIANVSHELRTPLTSIQGYSETLLDTIPHDSPQREFLEIIRKNASRMARLTEDLLALARVESGEKRFELEVVSPEDLLRDAAQHFAETAGGRNLQLEVKDEASQPVLADRDAIHHVFGNLLENAVKYGGSGTRVVLGARPLEDGVEFYVRDFGQGIPSEHLSRLFERFYRVDKARSRESGGTGLGLSIAKHIVLAHGGAIRAESELNHGATFLFTLPLASEENGDGHA